MAKLSDIKSNKFVLFHQILISITFTLYVVLQIIHYFYSYLF
jgi:hypothetical protein